MPDVPPIFRVAFAACDSSPVPESAVATVRVLLFVSVTPVTVMLGIDNVPVTDWELVLNVYTPVPAVKVPLFVIPPWIVIAELPELFHVAPELIVTRSVKVFVPVAEEMVSVPLVPPPTVVVPVTERAKPAAVKVVPLPTFKLPPILNPTTVVVEAVPLSVRLPDIAVVPVWRVFVPLVERLRLV